MKMKRFLSLCLGTVLCAGSMSLVACGTEKTAEAATVMNVSLNPAVEFVLDANDKVVSVNANNEEGNFVLNAKAFDNIEGKTADEALEIFVEVSTENGYLVKGNVKAGDNEINIAISGDTAKAEKIYNDAKAKVEAAFEKYDIQGKFEKAAAVTKAELEKVVAEVAPYIEEAKIKAMSEAELIKEIAASRKETAELYSQELKNAYYEAKAFALEQAKMEVVKAHLNDAQKLIVDGLTKTYSTTVNTIEELRKTHLLSEDSAYQKALADLRTKKAEYLKFKKDIAENPNAPQDVKDMMEVKLQAVTAAEQALSAAGELANKTIDATKKTLTATYNSIMEVFNKVNVDELADEISTKSTQAITKFTTDFETNYKTISDSAKTAWNDMADAIKSK